MAPGLGVDRTTKGVDAAGAAQELWDRGHLLQDAPVDLACAGSVADGRSDPLPRGQCSRGTPPLAGLRSYDGGISLAQNRAAPRPPSPSRFAGEP